MDARRALRKAGPWIIAVAVVALLIYGFKFMPVSVDTSRATRGAVIAEVMGTGTLEARFQTTVGAKIQGRLVKLSVDQGDRVKKGQVLARLDDAELRREVTTAQASLNAARATVERLKAEEARARAVLDQAGRDFHRYSSLRESSSISQENVEKSREKLAVAKADVEKAIAAVLEAERLVETAQERLHYQEARLDDTRIECPFDGLIVRRDRESGDVVIPGASIFQLISTREMWIAAWVDESAMAELSPAQPAKVVFRSEPEKAYRGSVARLGREVDRETREFRVDVKVDELPHNWAVGQRAEVYIQTGRKENVLAVPLGSVVWRNKKAAVYAVSDGRARLKPVTLGLMGMDLVEVASGLSEGDRVVSGANPAGISDGKRVRPR